MEAMYQGTGKTPTFQGEPMADKSCENCRWLMSTADCFYSSKCKDKLVMWKPITPPKPDEVVEVMCPFCKENEGRYCIFRDKTTRCCFSDKCDNGHNIKINPNKSPELIAWARSQALELVEIDEGKIIDIITDMMGDELSVEFIRLLGSRLKTTNPLKLKPQ